jgi:hypothetical protein
MLLLTRQFKRTPRAMSLAHGRRVSTQRLAVSQGTRLARPVRMPTGTHSPYDDLVTLQSIISRHGAQRIRPVSVSLSASQIQRRIFL